jgi:hypothetical protein
VPYRIAARDEGAWTALQEEEIAVAHRTSERRFRKRLKVVYAMAALILASAAVMMLFGVRLDYAHREREPGAGMCGFALVTCPENETCVLEDYSYAIPIGHCETPCEREHQTCSRTRTPRQCLHDDESNTLECVRVFGFGYR